MKPKNEALIDAVKDCIRYDLKRKEALKYIAKRLGFSISESYYYEVRAELESDPEIQAWLNDFTRIGYVLAHKKAIEEMERIQAKAHRALDVELARGENADWKKVSSLMAHIRENNKRLEELREKSPKVAMIKAMIEKQEKEEAKQDQAFTITPEDRNAVF